MLRFKNPKPTVKRIRVARLLQWLVALSMGMGSAAYANLPTGGNFTQGAGSINTTTNAVNVNVTGAVNSVARIDWASFNVGAGNSANFNNGTGAPTVNIVNVDNQGAMSQINGTINGTGSGTNILLVNPNGVSIGAGARIDTTGTFVAAAGTAASAGAGFGSGAGSITVTLNNAPVTVSKSATLIGQGASTIADAQPISISAPAGSKTLPAMVGSVDATITTASADLRATQGALVGPAVKVQATGTGAKITLSDTKVQAQQSVAISAKGQLELNQNTTVEAQQAGASVRLGGGVGGQDADLVNADLLKVHDGTSITAGSGSNVALWSSGYSSTFDTVDGLTVDGSTKFDGTIVTPNGSVFVGARELTASDISGIDTRDSINGTVGNLILQTGGRLNVNDYLNPASPKPGEMDITQLEGALLKGSVTLRASHIDLITVNANRTVNTAGRDLTFEVENLFRHQGGLGTNWQRFGINTQGGDLTIRQGVAGIRGTRYTPPLLDTIQIDSTTFNTQGGDLRIEGSSVGFGVINYRGTRSYTGDMHNYWNAAGGNITVVTNTGALNGRLTRIETSGLGRVDATSATTLTWDVHTGSVSVPAAPHGIYTEQGDITLRSGGNMFLRTTAIQARAVGANAGSITVQSGGTLDITPSTYTAVNGYQDGIRSEVYGSGVAGNITISATGNILSTAPIWSGGYVNTNGRGAALPSGNISITTPQFLDVADGNISTINAWGDAAALSTGNGPNGRITLSGGTIRLTGQDTSSLAMADGRYLNNSYNLAKGTPTLLRPLDSRIFSWGLSASGAITINTTDGNQRFNAINSDYLDGTFARNIGVRDVYGLSTVSIGYRGVGTLWDIKSKGIIDIYQSDQTISGALQRGLSGNALSDVLVRASTQTMGGSFSATAPRYELLGRERLDFVTAYNTGDIYINTPGNVGSSTLVSTEGSIFVNAAGSTLNASFINAWQGVSLIGNNIRSVDFRARLGDVTIQGADVDISNMLLGQGDTTINATGAVTLQNGNAGTLISNPAQASDVTINAASATVNNVKSNGALNITTSANATVVMAEDASMQWRDGITVDAQGSATVNRGASSLTDRSLIGGQLDVQAQGSVIVTGVQVQGSAAIRSNQSDVLVANVQTDGLLEVDAATSALVQWDADPNVQWAGGARIHAQDAVTVEHITLGSTGAVMINGGVDIQSGGDISVVSLSLAGDTNIASTQGNIYMEGVLSNGYSQNIVTQTQLGAVNGTVFAHVEGLGDISINAQDIRILGDDYIYADYDFGTQTGGNVVLNASGMIVANEASSSGFLGYIGADQSVSAQAGSDVVASVIYSNGSGADFVNVLAGGNAIIGQSVEYAPGSFAVGEVSVYGDGTLSIQAAGLAQVNNASTAGTINIVSGSDATLRWRDNGGSPWADNLNVQSSGAVTIANADAGVTSPIYFGSGFNVQATGDVTLPAIELNGVANVTSQQGNITMGAAFRNGWSAENGQTDIVANNGTATVHIDSIGDVRVQAQDIVLAGGQIYAGINYTTLTGGNVSLNATRDILDNSFAATGVAGFVGADVSLSAQAGRNIALADVQVYGETANSALTLRAGGDIRLVPDYELTTGVYSASSVIGYGDTNISIRADQDVLLGQNSFAGRNLVGGVSADNGTIFVQAGRNLSLGAEALVSSQNSTSEAITMVAGNAFSNLGQMQAQNGRWLVYSQDPALDVRGQAFDFKRYNCSFGGVAGACGNLGAPSIPTTGNGFVYSIAPVLNIRADNQTKVFGSADPTLTYTLGGGFIDGDDASILTGSLTRVAGETVAGGPYAITQGTLSDAGLGYQIQFVDGALSVTRATIGLTDLTLVGASVQNKVYDGTVSATINNPGTLTGVQGTDEVLIGTLSANFLTKDVGNNKDVIITGTLIGAQADNYQLLDTTVQANITAKQITLVGLQAQDKTYDATRNATLTGGALDGVIAGDAVVLDTSALTGTFDTKDVGSNKLVEIGGTPILTGADAINYSIAPIANSSASIAPRALVISNIGAQDKVFDGTVRATLVPGTLLGVLGADQVGTNQAGLVGAFDTPDVGTNKLVTIGGNALLTGTDASNYTLSINRTARAAITPAPVSAPAAPQQPAVQPEVQIPTDTQAAGSFNPITIRTSESVTDVELRTSEIILPLNSSAGTVQRQLQPAPQILSSEQSVVVTPSRSNDQAPTQLLAQEEDEQ